MAKQIQLRRGTTAENNAFRGALGEVTVDTDKKTVVVHDGLTVGGTPLATYADLSTNIINYLPLAYPKSTPPTGYLVLMGQTISQATYPILYGLYGSNLPDLRGQFLRGLDYGKGLDAGRNVLSVQQDAIQSHKHNLIADRNDNTNYHARGGSVGHVGNGYIPSYNEGSSWVSEPTNANVANETRVKNIAFLYIVKAG